MNKRRTPLVIVLFFLLCLGILPTHAALCEAADTNLLTNGSFEQLDSNGFPVGWTKDMYTFDDGVSIFDTLSDGAYDGTNYVRIRSFSENDARYEQTVACEPDSYYKLSGWARTENVTDEKMGANLSIDNCFTCTNVIQGTSDEWKYMNVYGKTGPDQTELTVMVRLGFYGSTITGTACFDNISLEKIDEEEIPNGSMFGLFYQEDSGSNDSGDTSTGTTDFTTAFLVIMAAYAALGLLLISLRSRNRLPSLAKSDAGEKAALYAMLAVAFVARVIIGVMVSGYPNDIVCWQGWGSNFNSNGPWGFYASGWCDYPPAYMYVLALIDGIRSLLGAGSDSGLSQLLVKLPAICCDIAGAALLFRWSKREKLEGGAAFWLAAFYAINPATMFDSSAWGQIDSVFTLLAVLAVYLCVNGSWKAAIPVYIVSALVKPQTLMLAPIALVVLIVEIVRAGDDRPKVLRDILIGLGISAAAAAVIIIPFWGGQSWNWLILKYTETLSSYNYATINAMNIFVLFNMNWADASTAVLGLPASVWGYVFMAIAVAYSALIYIKAKDRKAMPLACALLIMILFTFSTKMHERYAFPAIMLLLLSYVLLKDKRLLVSTLALTLAQFINMAIVLQSQHLQSAQQVLNCTIALLNIAATLYTAVCAWLICVKGSVNKFSTGVSLSKENGEDEVVNDLLTSKSRFGFFKAPSHREDMDKRIFGSSNYRIGMQKKDFLIVGIITVVYAVVAFTNLGTMDSPQTEWSSSQPGETVTVDLGADEEFVFTYYGGICNTTFNVEFSSDGVVWTTPQIAEYRQGKIFQWLQYRMCVENEDGTFTAVVSGYPTTIARYIRLTFASPNFKMREIGFLNTDGETLPIASITSDNYDAATVDDPEKMIDEQNTVPAAPSYYNSMYFDEIYHARTAYEHLHGLHTYEWTHPPLGKVLMMIGVALFGMCPFGWRFMGALVGVLMVPAMYLLVKQLFKRRDFAVFCTMLMTFDFMHFTQTRLATIDSYGVFFIMIMYLFMFRYMQMSFFRDKFKSTLVPLGLSGLFMGIGCASKWIDIYAAAGLAVLFFATMWMRYREYRFAVKRLNGYDSRSINYLRMKKVCDKFVPYTIYTLLLCCVFFIAVPLLIYFFSYYWQLTPDGNFTIQGVIDMQKSMMNYHAGLTNDDHPFRAAWYTWPFILKPMYYYSGREFAASGFTSIIWAMGNPAVWWTSFVGMLFTMYLCIREKFKDRQKLIVIVSFLTQYLPWVLVPRSMYIYHYFASVPFLIISLCFSIKFFEQAYPKATKRVMYAFMALAVILFIMFYPVISGYPCSFDYINFLNMLGPWYLY